jgi:hypothetical protein
MGLPTYTPKTVDEILLAHIREMKKYETDLAKSALPFLSRKRVMARSRACRISLLGAYNRLKQREAFAAETQAQLGASEPVDPAKKFAYPKAE